MGTYVYRVTSKKVRCSDGEYANVAVFAYKPTWDIWHPEHNSRWHNTSGAGAADRAAERGSLTNRFVYGTKDENGKIIAYPNSAVFVNPNGRVGSFYDSTTFDTVKGVVSSATVKEAA